MTYPANIVLDQIREAGDSKRGKPNSFAHLPDDTLLELCQRIQGGYSNPAIATWLHDSGHAPGKSRHATAKMLQKFRKRINHILVGRSFSPPPREPTDSIPQHPSVNELIQAGDLEQIDSLLTQYEALLSRLFAEAATGPPNKDLSKHVQAFSQLTKARLKVLEDARNRPSGFARTREQRQRDQVVWDQFLSGLPDDGNALMRAADRLLRTIEKDILTLEIFEDGSHEIRPATEAEKNKDLAFGICGGITSHPPESELSDHGELKKNF